MLEKTANTRYCTEYCRRPIRFETSNCRYFRFFRFANLPPNLRLYVIRVRARVLSQYGSRRVFVNVRRDQFIIRQLIVSTNGRSSARAVLATNYFRHSFRRFSRFHSRRVFFRRFSRVTGRTPAILIFPIDLNPDRVQIRR